MQRWRLMWKGALMVVASLFEGPFAATWPFCPFHQNWRFRDFRRPAAINGNLHMRAPSWRCRYLRMTCKG